MKRKNKKMKKMLKKEEELTVKYTNCFLWGAIAQWM